MKFGISAVPIVLWVYSCGLSSGYRDREEGEGNYLERLWVGDVVGRNVNPGVGIIDEGSGPTYCVLDSTWVDDIHTGFRDKELYHLADYGDLKISTSGVFECTDVMIWHPETKFAIGKGWAYIKTPYKWDLEFAWKQDCVHNGNLINAFSHCIKENGGADMALFNTGECDHLAKLLLDPCESFWECPPERSCLTPFTPSSILDSPITSTPFPNSVTNRTTTLSGDAAIDGCNALIQDLFTNLTAQLADGSLCNGSTTLAPNGSSQSVAIDGEHGQYGALLSSGSKEDHSLRNRNGIIGICALVVFAALMCGWLYRRRQVRRAPVIYNDRYNPVMTTDITERSAGAVKESKLTM